jgi:hypothetical protein
MSDEGQTRWGDTEEQRSYEAQWTMMTRQQIEFAHRHPGRIRWPPTDVQINALKAALPTAIDVFKYVEMAEDALRELEFRFSTRTQNNAHHPTISNRPTTMAGWNRKRQMLAYSEKLDAVIQQIFCLSTSFMTARDDEDEDEDDDDGPNVKRSKYSSSSDDDEPPCCPYAGLDLCCKNYSLVCDVKITYANPIEPDEEEDAKLFADGRAEIARRVLEEQEKH